MANGRVGRACSSKSFAAYESRFRRGLSTYFRWLDHDPNWAGKVRSNGGGAGKATKNTVLGRHTVKNIRPTSEPAPAYQEPNAVAVHVAYADSQSELFDYSVALVDSNVTAIARRAWRRARGVGGSWAAVSGPSNHAVPVRATAQALIELISEAKHELLLMTYSAKPHDDIRTALASAVARGVAVKAVVETLQGAGSALAGAEPAAFSSIPEVQLWHWPMGQRTETGSKMHAKLAVADRRVLFVSSANLTQSGVAKNIGTGLACWSAAGIPRGG